MKVSGMDIAMTRGDSEWLIVSCPDRPFTAGDAVEMTVRRYAGVGPVLIHKRVTEFHDGRAAIELTPEDTMGLPFCTASYDVQITLADGTVKTVVKPSPFRIGRENTYGE